VNAFLKHLRRGAFAIGSGVFLGLIAAFGLVAPVFVQHPVVYAAPADALPPCPAYQALLDQYLTVLRAKDGDVQRPVMTTFDYARLALYPDGKTKLDAARKELFAVQPARLGPKARVAWGINAHNFDVIDTIVKYGFPDGKPVASVRDIRSEQADVPPLEVRNDGTQVVAPEGAWPGDPRYELLGSDGFNAIEQSLLAGKGSPRADLEGAHKGGVPPPAQMLDPRVHFALTNGARGGPPLHPQAYRPETLDTQLEDVTRGALLGSKHLRWHGMTKDLAVSQIFEWYVDDFGGPDSAFAFVLRHVPAHTVDQIRAAGITKIPGYIECEWTLNQTPQR